MEEYIGTVIKVGGILIGSIMVLFVIWYIVGKFTHICPLPSTLK